VRDLATIAVGGLLVVTSVPAAAQTFEPITPRPAAFADTPVDARGEALGLATTVAPRGATAFWWNPAPLPEGPDLAASLTSWDFPIDDVSWRPLAARVTRGNLTAGVLWAHQDIDIPVRTAYEPDADAVYPANDLVQIGLATDLVPWLGGRDSPWTWVVGASLTWFRTEVREVESALDGDLGTSVAWRTSLGEAGPVLRLHGTAMVHHLARATLDGEALPRTYRLGAGVELVPQWRWRGRPVVALAAMAVLRRDLEDIAFREDSEHVGVELVGGGVLAARVGYRNVRLFSDDGWSWGFGLRHGTRRLAGLSVALDFASCPRVEALGGGRQEHWTLAVSFDELW
jgi:hypothetical protein